MACYSELREHSPLLAKSWKAILQNETRASLSAFQRHAASHARLLTDSSCLWQKLVAKNASLCCLCSVRVWPDDRARAKSYDAVFCSWCNPHSCCCIIQKNTSLDQAQFRAWC